MRPRSHLPDPERRARSRLTQILHDQPFLCGSLVTMRRTCGKPGCKCTRGDLHPGLYLEPILLPFLPEKPIAKMPPPPF